MARNRLKVAAFVFAGARSHGLQRVIGKPTEARSPQVEAGFHTAMPALSDVSVTQRADIEIDFVLHVHLVSGQTEIGFDGAEYGVVIDTGFVVGAVLWFQVRTGKRDGKRREGYWNFSAIVELIRCCRLE